MTLEQFFQEHSKVAVAFSGGVDSAFLLWAAVRSGADVKAYYAASAFQPQFERDDALRLAKELGVSMEVLPVDVLCREEIVSNPPDRCYHCKTLLFSAISEASRRDRYPILLDGTNASDDPADRPGVRALQELQVCSPLRECGLTKPEIRRLSREAGLFTHDKPAYACLATRIPVWEPITEDKLARTERAEMYLTSLGFRNFRVRMQGDDAKLQVTAEDLPLVLQHRKTILMELKKDYHSVVLDLEVRV